MLGKDTTLRSEPNVWITRVVTFPVCPQKSKSCREMKEMKETPVESLFLAIGWKGD